MNSVIKIKEVPLFFSYLIKVNESSFLKYFFFNCFFVIKKIDYTVVNYILSELLKKMMLQIFNINIGIWNIS